MEGEQEYLAQEARVAETRIGRRRLIEQLGLAGGALVASALLPNRWVKPVASQEPLPTPTQTSPVLGTGDLQVTLTWNTDETDLDLWVQEPTGEWINWDSPTGPTGELDYDDTDGYGPENIYVAPGAAAAGTYKVYVGYYWSHVDGPPPPTTATIRITTFDGTPQKQQQIYTRLLTVPDETCVLFYVGTATFPSGNIAEQSGSIANPVFDWCAVGSSSAAPRKR